MNPTNDGKVIRLPIPPLTQERRKQLAKSVAHIGEQHKVAVRQVRLGPAEGEHTAIDEGLSPGDLVVVEGAERLRAGVQVELKNQSPGNSGKSPAPSGSTR